MNLARFRRYQQTKAGKMEAQAPEITDRRQFLLDRELERQKLETAADAEVGTLLVTGDLTVLGDVALAGNLTVAGNFALTGNLAVTGNLLVTGSLTLQGAFAHQGSTFAVFNGTPATQAAAYTQTYSTAARTVNAATALSLSDNTGGAGGGTIEDVTAVHDQSILNNNFADITDRVNSLIADNLNLRQLLNALIDDSQRFSFTP